MSCKQNYHSNVYYCCSCQQVVDRDLRQTKTQDDDGIIRTRYWHESCLRSHEMLQDKKAQSPRQKFFEHQTVHKQLMLAAKYYGIRKLARDVGISRKHLDSFLDGKSTMSVDRVEAIAAKLGLRFVAVNSEIASRLVVERLAGSPNALWPVRS